MTNLTFVPRDPQDADLAKKFTRACLKVGLLREIKPRRYVNPSMKRRLKNKVARAKLAKTARRHAAGEGCLVAAPRGEGVAAKRAEARRGVVLCSARLRTPWRGRWRCRSIRVIE